MATSKKDQMCPKNAHGCSITSSFLSLFYVIIYSAPLVRRSFCLLLRVALDEFGKRQKRTCWLQKHGCTSVRHGRGRETEPRATVMVARHTTGRCKVFQIRANFKISNWLQETNLRWNGRRGDESADEWLLHGAAATRRRHCHELFHGDNWLDELETWIGDDKNMRLW